MVYIDYIVALLFTRYLTAQGIIPESLKSIIVYKYMHYVKWILSYILYQSNYTQRNTTITKKKRKLYNFSVNDSSLKSQEYAFIHILKMDSFNWLYVQKVFFCFCPFQWTLRLESRQPFYDNYIKCWKVYRSMYSNFCGVAALWLKLSVNPSFFLLCMSKFYF